MERAEGVAGQQMIESRARVRPASGACWMEAAGALAMFDGVHSPLTQTFGLGIFEMPSPDALTAIESFFATRGAAINHEVSPVADPALLGLLVARGYHPIELTSVMFRPIAGDAPPAAAPSAIRVRAVASDDETAAWTKTAAEGWSSEHADLGSFMLEMGRVQAGARGYHLFLADLDGQPVAAGGLSIHEGVALLAGASTVPSARRRGAQLALLEARLRHAAALGCDLAMMGALPGSGSQRNAERHGFRIAYTRIKWSRSL